MQENGYTVVGLPSKLTLRVHRSRSEEDRRAEELLRHLISEYGKDPNEVLQIEDRADWPASEDAPDFRFPQIIANDEYWAGWAAVEAYVAGQRRALSFYKKRGIL